VIGKALTSKRPSEPIDILMSMQLVDADMVKKPGVIAGAMLRTLVSTPTQSRATDILVRLSIRQRVVSHPLV
jgi:hypothetical protein